MNYQNFPRKSRVNKAIVARPGFVFLFADYSQIEIRIAAWYTRDKSWINDYKNGVDVHERTGAIVFGRPIETEEERVFAKGFNFAMAYGASKGRVKSLLKILYGEEQPEHDELAGQMLDKFYKEHPNIKKFKYIVADRMSTDQERRDHFLSRGWRSIPHRLAPYRGYIKTRYERIFKIPYIINYKALEWVTSGDGTGDFITEKFIQTSQFFIDRRLDGGPVAVKHDEIIFEIPDKPWKNTVALEIKEMMEDAPEITKILPLKVDLEFGKTWFKDDKESVAFDY